jgi:propionyl-CoA carboxylase alpha chain
MGITTVAVYSEADRTSPHVLYADEAYCIGAPPAKESYLRGDTIIEVATQCNADAIHPGYGFLSENSAFATLTRDAGIIFIGPSPEAIKQLGDKTKAKQLLRDTNVPTVPGTDEAIASSKEAQRIAQEIGYPVLIKAAAGGGGKGMRVIKRAEELENAIRLAQSEAFNAFKDDRVFIEKYIASPRHIEFQILADNYGNVIHLGERECSIQRRHQKIIEESPSPVMTQELREKMGNAAVAVARSAGYSNAGTVEFLVDENHNYYFLEVNTRLQVEHPVTEIVTGIDIVREQIHIAEGEQLRWKQEDINFRGHAIECRVYAEDPANNFLPSIGKIHYLHSPGGVGVREDRGIAQGNEVTIYYDPMLAKLITYGENRNTAIQRMVSALQEYSISGVITNIAACISILQHKEFNEGNITTGFIQQFFPEGFKEQISDEEYIISAIASAVMMNKHSNEIRQNTINPTHASQWKQQRKTTYR